MRVGVYRNGMLRIPARRFYRQVMSTFALWEPRPYVGPFEYPKWLGYITGQR